MRSMPQADKLLRSRPSSHIDARPSTVREIRKFTDSQLPWKKGGLRGRDRTRRIAFDFGQKLAEVDVELEALERVDVEDHDRSLAELFSFSSKWSLQAR